MGSISEINRFLNEKIKDSNLEEVDAITAAKWLENKGLLKDSSHRPGLPLRRYLREGKINGSYQYPNRRWVIRRSFKENSYSVKEAAAKLGITDHAIYKRIDRGTIKYEKMGESSFVIPESEIIREQKKINKIDDIILTNDIQYRFSVLKKQVSNIRQEFDNILNNVSEIERMITGDTVNMNFNNLNKLKKYGFEGFKKIYELKESKSFDIPEKKGVYLVLIDSIDLPLFLDKSEGGNFKGKNPTVNIDLLKQKWINDTKVLYIGKAGGEKSKATLKSRIKQLIAFGSGKAVGHWGGRYLWQLQNNDNLIVCWKILSDDNPRDIETNLITSFVVKYGTLPFANMNE